MSGFRTHNVDLLSPGCLDVTLQRHYVSLFPVSWIWHQHNPGYFVVWPEWQPIKWNMMLKWSLVKGLNKSLQGFLDYLRDRQRLLTNPWRSHKHSRASGETQAVSQCRVKLLQSHYFKHTTSSSGAESLFKCPAYMCYQASLLDIEKRPQIQCSLVQLSQVSVMQ